MRTMGIDQSYTSCGVVILEGNNIIHIEKITSSTEEDKPARAWAIAKKVLGVAKKFKPDKIAIEGLAFGMRGDATRDLAGLQFIIICLLRYTGGFTNIDVISPPSVKKFATGRGRADKQLMIESLPEDVRNIFDGLGVMKTTGLADLTDAYWIAKMVGEK